MTSINEAFESLDDLIKEASYSACYDGDHVRRCEIKIKHVLNCTKDFEQNSVEADKQAIIASEERDRILAHCRNVESERDAALIALQSLHAALTRQSDNMDFVLNHMDVKNFCEKFTAELEVDRQALYTNRYCLFA